MLIRKHILRSQAKIRASKARAKKEQTQTKKEDDDNQNKNEEEDESASVYSTIGLFHDVPTELAEGLTFYDIRTGMFFISLQDDDDDAGSAEHGSGCSDSGSANSGES